MTTTLIVVLIVSAALLIGAAWGLWGGQHEKAEGFFMALAGGALLVSVVSELVEPSIAASNLWVSCAGLAGGAVMFAFIDYLIDEKWAAAKGSGLLAAITLDGIPENLALGVALIGAGAPEVAALAGSILLSNLPEAASGARQMRDGGLGKARIMGLWLATTVLLAGAAMGGNMLLVGASEHVLALIRCIAAGAVVASLATEVFPEAFKEDRHWAGVATALGVILALGLGELGAG